MIKETVAVFSWPEIRDNIVKDADLQNWFRSGKLVDITNDCDFRKFIEENAPEVDRVLVRC